MIANSILLPEVARQWLGWQPWISKLAGNADMSKIVERTLDVFEMFANEKRPMSLTEMAHRLDIPISSCHDVMRALEARGFVYETAPRAGYYPTRRLFDVATVIAANDSLVQRAGPRLEALCSDLGETVTLSKASAMHVIYLLVLEPAHPIRFSVSAGSEIRSMVATSAGKAYLSTLSEAMLERFFERAELVKLTAQTITEKSSLLADIRRSKQRGWFLNQEESLAGVVTISVIFVWNRASHIVTVAGPAERMNPKLERASEALMRTCAELADSKF
jgi:DNA-binding IclR family transcriptional regulator